MLRTARNRSFLQFLKKMKAMTSPPVGGLLCDEYRAQRNDGNQLNTKSSIKQIDGLNQTEKRTHKIQQSGIPITKKRTFFKGIESAD